MNYQFEKKDVEKEKKKNLKHVVNAPGSKVAMFVDNNDNKNNFKNYSIEYLKMMNDKLQLNEKINFPIFPKWEYR